MKGELLDRSGLFVPATLLGCLSHSSLHARRRGELWGTLENRYRVLSSRGSRSSDRGARVDERARSRSGGFR